jgi:hypothetical protein
LDRKVCDLLADEEQQGVQTGFLGEQDWLKLNA